MFDSSLIRRTLRARNMGEMIRRLGIEPVFHAIDGGRGLREVAESCVACRSGEECRDWLATHSGSLEAAPSFCPNAVRFQRMRH
jgi:hypothetical protein